MQGFQKPDVGGQHDVGLVELVLQFLGPGKQLGAVEVIPFDQDPDLVWCQRIAENHFVDRPMGLPHRLVLEKALVPPLEVDPLMTND
jgi:hypothetical protein